MLLDNVLFFCLSQAFFFNIPNTCRNYWWSVCYCWVSTSVGSLGMPCILVWFISTGSLQIMSRILDPKRPLICFPCPFLSLNVVIATPSVEALPHRVQRIRHQYPGASQHRNPAEVMCPCLYGEPRCPTDA